MGDDEKDSPTPQGFAMMFSLTEYATLKLEEPIKDS